MYEKKRAVGAGLPAYRDATWRPTLRILLAEAPSLLNRVLAWPRWPGVNLLDGILA
jgi:hypothetical protein